MAAIGAKQAGGDGETGCDHTGRLDVEAVYSHQILWQPQRQSDEGAEDEEIVEREAPDLHVAERCEFKKRALRALAGQPALPDDRIVLGGHVEQDGHHSQCRRPHLGHGMPAERDQHQRRQELGDSGADVAGTEDAKRYALPLGREET
jgi:hypothetical protein